MSLFNQSKFFFQCDLESAQNSLTVKNNELENMKKEIDKLKELNNAFKQNYDKMSAKCNDLETDKSRSEKKISCLENELDIKTKEKNTIAKTCEDVLTKAERVAAEKKELEKTNTQLVTEKDQLGTQYEELNEKVLYLFRRIFLCQ